MSDKWLERARAHAEKRWFDPDRDEWAEHFAPLLAQVEAETLELAAQVCDAYEALAKHGACASCTHGECSEQRSMAKIVHGAAERIREHKPGDARRKLSHAGSNFDLQLTVPNDEPQQ